MVEVRHFEMKMRSSRYAAGTNFSNEITFFNLLARLNIDLSKMRISGLNYEAMFAFDYDEDQHPICKMLNISGKKGVGDSHKHGYSDECLLELDQTLLECAEILNKNFDKVSDSNRLLIGKQLRKAYLIFLDFFKTYASQGSVYGWKDKWDDLINLKYI